MATPSCTIYYHQGIFLTWLRCLKTPIALYSVGKRSESTSHKMAAKEQLLFKRQSNKFDWRRDEFLCIDWLNFVSGVLASPERVCTPMSKRSSEENTENLKGNNFGEL